MAHVPTSDPFNALAAGEGSLLDLLDNLLDKGVVLSGELVLGIADVDLIYARLSLLLCAADRVLPKELE
jgi:hypothetical protein